MGAADPAAIEGGGAFRVAAVVLAAGTSRRMGGVNKLLAEVGGRPVLQRVLDAVAGCDVDPIVVVTGHDSERVEQLLARRDVVIAHNPHYAAGLSTSLRCGLATLPPAVDGALICLGDMPRLEARHLRGLLGAFAPARGCAVCVPVYAGRRGNPVLWARRFFDEMAAVEGDAGAGRLLAVHADVLCEVPMEDDAVLHDVDSPADLARAQRA